MSSIELKNIGVVSFLYMACEMKETRNRSHHSCRTSSPAPRNRETNPRPPYRTPGVFGRFAPGKGFSVNP